MPPEKPKTNGDLSWGWIRENRWFLVLLVMVVAGGVNQQVKLDNLITTVRDNKVAVMDRLVQHETGGPHGTVAEQQATTSVQVGELAKDVEKLDKKVERNWAEQRQKNEQILEGIGELKGVLGANGVHNPR